jgi:cleavage and polyadenylation specificity factor subunit 1
MNSGATFLIDTGAFVSVYPFKSSDAEGFKADTSPALIAANGTRIRTYGTVTKSLQFNNQSYTWKFLLADVNLPLIGADFLSHYELLVDVANQRLIDSQSLQCHSPTLGTTPLGPGLIGSVSNAFTDLFRKYQNVFKPELSQIPGRVPKHGIWHHIETTGRPAHQKFRRLTPAKLQLAKKYFADMVKMGICKKESSPWAAPLHMVPKADGTFRPCGDYRLLNEQTVPDRYPTPNIADLTSMLAGARVFSKIDLLKGYFQVPVHPDDVPKTAIVTPFGSYVFYFSTFGLRNAGCTFQRMMDQIFGDLPFMLIYVDDLLIFSKNAEDHRHHLEKVLQLMSDNGLVARLDKCVFGVDSVEFLGHHINADGIRPLDSKVSAVRDFPRPSSIKAVQEFTGLINYYHRFIPRAAHIMAPLYDAISREDFVWTDAHDVAFQAAKDALANATMLSYPHPDIPVRLVTDASDVAVGAALEQVVNDHPRPIAFFSKKLRPCERKYSVFDRELLAVYLAIRHFKHWLDGTQFTVLTDHRPLVEAFLKKSDAWSARQQRHLSSIAEMNCDMQHVPGSTNAAADALSRIQINSITLGLDYHAMATAQIEDLETNAYRTAITGLQWQDVDIGGATLLCDVSTGRPRPLVPRLFRRRVFDLIHGISHPGIRTTQKLISSKFVWHSMSRDVRSWARSCMPCQRSKTTRHQNTGIGQFPLPRRRFGHIHVDIVGPLCSSQGQRYLFTIIDRSTRWLEAIPMTGITAADCASALLSGWVSRFGIPDHITSDRGRQFISNLWNALAMLMGSKLHTTTSYRPQSNGLVERVHRCIKASLMARCSRVGSSWMQHLPWVLLGLRTVPHEGLHVSSAEMVYGDPLVLPGEFFPDDDAALKNHDLQRLRRIVGGFAPWTATKHSRHTEEFRFKALKFAPYVFIRDDAIRAPLVPPYKGPYAVVLRREKSYQLEIDGRLDWVAIDRLKPAYTLD